MRSKYQRVLLKLSGDHSPEPRAPQIDTERLGQYAEQIKEIASSGVEVAIVIGGGNIFRGLSGATRGFDRVKGDQMGMLATVINSLALSSALESVGQLGARADGYQHVSDRGALQQMEGHRGSGSGGRGGHHSGRHPQSVLHHRYGQRLRGIEVEADVMLKGTRVDGVYTADPEKDSTATKFSEISYDEVYNRGLKVMDLTATALCKENGLPIVVFCMDTPGNLAKVIAKRADRHAGVLI